MKDPIEILAERLARLEQEGHISASQRQKAVAKLNTAKAAAQAAQARHTQA